MTASPLLAETTLTPAQAAAHVRGMGGRTTRYTVVRWATTGILAGGRRVKLEMHRCGGRWVTSLEAVSRFLAAVTAGAGGEAQPVRTPAKRRRESAAASARLAAAGW